MFSVDFTFEWYGDTIVYMCIHFYFFLFRSNIRKRYLDESDFRYLSGNLFEVPFLRFPDHNHVKLSSQQLRDTLTTAF